MAAMDDRVEAAVDGLRAVQEVIEAYDDVGWDVDEPLAKLRHVVLHLNKSLGEIAAVAERLDHERVAGGALEPADVAVPAQALAGRCADLVSSAAQIATIARIDLGPSWTSRVRTNLGRVPGEDPRAQALVDAFASDEPKASGRRPLP